MEFVHNLSMYDALSELSGLSKRLQTMDITLPEALSRLSGQGLISACVVVCLGIYAIKMAVPNKICTVKTGIRMTAKLLKSM